MSTDAAVYRKLASAVIHSAVQDVRTVGDGERRSRAYRFLATPNEDLVFWCAVAGMDVKAINGYVRQRWQERFAA